MSESPNKKQFVKNLLAQDPPPADKQLRHKEVLFEKVKRRIWLGKIIGGAIYIALFSVAFWVYTQRQNTENVVHSICWGAVSLHILLWFLIYFLRAIYRTLAEIIDSNPEIDKKPWKNTDRFITALAVLTFAYGTIILYRSFSLTDPLKAAHLAASNFWATVFFLFWYPFGTASLLAKLWLEYKKMELNITKTSGEEV